MARLFDNGQSEYLIRDEAVVSGEPFAVVCWFNTDTDANLPLIIISTGASPWEIYSLSIKGAIAGNPIEIGTYSGDWTSARTITGFTVDQWHHAAGIFVGSASRRVFIDGGSRAVSVESEIIGNVTKTYIGASAGVGSTFSGQIAEAAIYDLSDWPGVTDNDKANNFQRILPSLAKGFTPDNFPLGLKAYWPLVRGLNDKIGGYNLTASGTVVAAHSRVILPHGPQY